MIERLTTQPTLPISSGDLKRALGVTGDEHDRDIEELQQAAVNVFRRWTGREPVSTQYRLSLACWPNRIPLPPLQSIESVSYYDVDGVDQTLNAADYQLVTSDISEAEFFPAPNAELPGVQQGRVNAVRIEFTAGDAEPLPEVKQFIKLLVRHWYDNPSAVVTGTISKEIELSLRSIASSLHTGYYADV